MSTYKIDVGPLFMMPLWKYEFEPDKIHCLLLWREQTGTYRRIGIVDIHVLDGDDSNLQLYQTDIVMADYIESDRRGLYTIDLI